MNNTKKTLKNAISTTLWPGASGKGGGRSILVVARAEGVRRKKEVMLIGKKSARGKNS